MIVRVVSTVTRCSIRIFWKVPASWSECVCVRMTWVMRRDEMPLSRRKCAECAGGSTNTPRPRIQRMKPAVASLFANPSAAPKTVMPNSGASNAGGPTETVGIST